MGAVKKLIQDEGCHLKDHIDCSDCLLCGQESCPQNQEMNDELKLHDITPVEYKTPKRKSNHQKRKSLLDKVWSGSCHCYLCGLPIYLRKHASADHIIPKSKGGSNALGNLRPTHKWCNERKGDQEVESFLENYTQVESMKCALQYFIKITGNEIFDVEEFLCWLAGPTRIKR